MSLHRCSLPLLGATSRAPSLLLRSTASRRVLSKNWRQLDRPRFFNSTRGKPFPQAAIAEAHTKPPSINNTRSGRHGLTLNAEESNESTVAVLSNGKRATFDSVLLRDSCQCPRCKDPSSQQKLFQTCDIPANIKARPSVVGDELVIKWANDVPGYGEDHESRFSSSWLMNDDYKARQLQALQKIPWSKSVIEKNNKWIEYHDYMSSEEQLYAALEHIHVYGLLFLRNVPDDEKAIERIVERIGPLKNTFYGHTWDVRSVPDAKNIAYTHQYLGLHMDLMYTQNPPHLQLLHSLRARAPGGESLFSDCLYAANRLWAQSPRDFQTLADFKVPYEYDNDSEYYWKQRQTIGLNPKDRKELDLTAEQPPVPLSFAWSPPFQGSFPKSNAKTAQASRALRRYRAAAAEFAKLIEAPDALFEYRMAEGDCMIFDNRRVLHARRAFDAAKGERWLKGAYVDNDVFFSRLRVLQNQFSGQNSAREA